MTRAYLKDSRGLRAFMVERAIFERRDLTAHEKLVLCYLAMRANSESECWPSYNTIGADCSMSRRQAMRVVGTLEDKGLLTKSSRSNDLGRFTSNLFRLFSAEEPVFPPSQDPAGDDGDTESPWHAGQGNGDSQTPPGDSTAPTPVTPSHLYEQDQLEGESGNRRRAALPPSTLEPALGSSTVDSPDPSHSQLLSIARHPARPAAVASDDSSSPRTTRSEAQRRETAETAAAFLLTATTRRVDRSPLRAEELLPAIDRERIQHRTLLEGMGYDASSVFEGLVCATCSGTGNVVVASGDQVECPACSQQPALF